MDKLILAMLAGARAIDQSKRLSGATYVYDVFAENQEKISYFEAENLLLETADKMFTAEINT